jgi:ABC-type transporter Mla subunit MlaD
MAVAAAFALAMAASGCVGPARTEGDFARKASTSAKSVRSAVETARVGADLAKRGKGFSTYLSVLLSEAEEDASKVQSAFDSIDPPNRVADRQRAELDDLMQQTASVLADLRIAARRGQLERLPDIAQPLPDLSDRLQRFDDSLQDFKK